MSLIIKPPLPRLRRSHPLTRGLVGAWMFSEGSGNKLHDISGRDNHGTLGTSVVWGAGQRGPALDFSGEASSQARVDTTGSIGLAVNSHVTLGAILKLDSRTPGDGIIAEVSGVEFILRIASGDNTKWEFILNSFLTNDRVSGGANDLTNWFSVFGRFDGSTIDLFENGTEVASVTPTGSWAGTSQPVQFGTLNSSTSTMDGQIAWSAIWARGLSDSEISEMSRDPMALVDQPRSYWMFGVVGGADDESSSSSSSSSSTEQSVTSSSSSSSSSTFASETSSSSSSSNSSSSTFQSLTSSSSSSSSSTVQSLTSSSSSSSSSTFQSLTSSSSSSSSSTEASFTSSSSSNSSSSSTVASETSSSSDSSLSSQSDESSQSSSSSTFASLTSSSSSSSSSTAVSETSSSSSSSSSTVQSLTSSSSSSSSSTAQSETSSSSSSSSSTAASFTSSSSSSSSSTVASLTSSSSPSSQSSSSSSSSTVQANDNSSSSSSALEAIIATIRLGHAPDDGLRKAQIIYV